MCEVVKIFLQKNEKNTYLTPFFFLTRYLSKFKKYRFVTIRVFPLLIAQLRNFVFYVDYFNCLLGENEDDQ
jgi:hypothetical protein